MYDFILNKWDTKSTSNYWSWNWTENKDNGNEWSTCIEFYGRKADMDDF